jgi:hypothetical protein
MRIAGAIVACLHMAAERRRSASRDGAHDAPLDAAKVTFVSTAIGTAVAANDIRHLQARGHVIRSGRRHGLQRQRIECARRASDKLVRDLCNPAAQAMVNAAYTSSGSAPLPESAPPRR